MGWLSKALLAMLLVTIPFISAGFFKMRGVKPEQFCNWYYLGCSIGVFVWCLWSGINTLPKIGEHQSGWHILAIGMVIGAAVQILLFGAMEKAPNPGLAIALVNTCTMIVTILSSLLYKYLPKHFPEAKFDTAHFVGIALTIIGAVIIGWKR